MELRRIFGMRSMTSLDTYVDIETTRWLPCVKGDILQVGVGGPEECLNNLILQDKEAYDFIDSFGIDRNSEADLPRAITGHSVVAYYWGNELVGLEKR